MPPKIYNAKNAKTAKNAKKAKKAKKPNLLQGASQRARPQRLILPPWPRQKRVGGGGPPLGVSMITGLRLHSRSQRRLHSRRSSGAPDATALKIAARAIVLKVARQRPTSDCTQKRQGAASTQVPSSCVVVATIGSAT